MFTNKIIWVIPEYKAAKHTWSTVLHCFPRSHFLSYPVSAFLPPFSPPSRINSKSQSVTTLKCSLLPIYFFLPEPYPSHIPYRAGSFPFSYPWNTALSTFLFSAACSFHSTPSLRDLIHYQGINYHFRIFISSPNFSFQARAHIAYLISYSISTGFGTWSSRCFKLNSVQISSFSRSLSF